MDSGSETPATRTVDVREIDEEPFTAIMRALDELGSDETVLLINGFEPEPLYDVLEQRGFAYETTRRGSDEWHVEITPT